MARRRALAIVLGSAVLWMGLPAAARPRPERRCQAAVARSGRATLALFLDAYGACRRRVARGAAAECTTDAAVARARGLLGKRVARRIAKACANGATGELHFGGACTRAATPTLAACILASHEEQAADLIDVTDPPVAQSPGGRRCQVNAARRARRFATGRLRILQRCKQRPPRGLLPGDDCRSDPRTAARIAELAARASRAVTHRCTGDALAAARFGAPCDGAGDGAALAACLLAVAASASDATVDAASLDRGFCGDALPAVEKRIDALLGGMTLEEKIDQMHGNGLASTGWGTAANDRLGIPGFGMYDGPRGVSMLAGSATAFPVGIARGATWDPALEERVGEAVGVEIRATGASVLLAPTINIVRHPRWGRTQESYGEDTVHLGQMAVGFIRGAQRHVLASAKHFAANSVENTRFSLDVSVDERSLREVYTPHFRMAVQDGHVASVMSAYNLVNGRYCAENPHLLTDILKQDWGFQGFVESDWVFGTRSTAPSANAGLDIEMPGNTFFGPPLLDAVGAGEVAEATIDAAVRRILRAKLCFRLDTDPPVPDPTRIDTPAHRALAREVAQKAIVLLKNENATLPLDPVALQSIVVVGPLAALANLGDHGSSSVDPSSAVTPLDGIRAAAGAATVTHVTSAPFTPEESATIAAADAAVVVVGLTTADEGEGLITVGDRTSLALPGDQNALVAAVAALTPHTVVVLEGSGPVTMPWLDDVATVLMAWYPGEEGGAAIADVLFGAVTPSGKLPLSFPRAESDLPPFDDTSHAVTYGYLHGYRWLDAHDTPPLFPFGFGLSYTTFEYANLTVTPTSLPPEGRLVVTAEVTNTGAVPGDEVAQLYVSAIGSGVERAPKDLKAFARIHVAPGETQTVHFELRASDLAFWNAAGGAFEVEPIAYAARVGSSAADLPLEGTFAVTGPAAP